MLVKPCINFNFAFRCDQVPIPSEHLPLASGLEHLLLASSWAGVVRLEHLAMASSWAGVVGLEHLAMASSWAGVVGLEHLPMASSWAGVVGLEPSCIVGRSSSLAEVAGCLPCLELTCSALPVG